MQRANGTASLLFGAIVVLLSYATLSPFFLKGETNTARSFGPFTPSRERDVGAPRTASACQCMLQLSHRCSLQHPCVICMCDYALRMQRCACALYDKCLRKLWPWVQAVLPCSALPCSWQWSLPAATRPSSEGALDMEVVS